MSKTDIQDVGYLCSDCAREVGGRWPENHQATFHKGKCGMCGEEKSICNIRNWIFDTAEEDYDEG